ncbi:MAG TPA: transglycosylase domain-containing protein, partial [Ktedonobacteraceae bacterium]|nr:transglycosylase domain-containing protein [Ktedonobacteraceae bacterium]
MNSNNYRNEQGDNTYPSANNGNGHGAPRSGGLLRQYSPSPLPPQSQQSFQPPQSSPMPAPQGWPSPPSPLSPMPQGYREPQNPPAQSMQPYQPMQPAVPMPPAQQQSWAQGGRSAFANAMQTVRGWSGKIVAARTGNYVEPAPLVIYRPRAAEPLRRKPWRRSRAVRVARFMRKRRGRWENSGASAKKIWRTTFTVFAVMLVVLLSSGVASAFAYYQSQLPRLQGLANQQVEQSSRIYDRNGKLLYVAYDGKYGRGTPISYSNIPGVMQDAMIAAEDKTFWSNTGIDPQGILRAASEYASTGAVQGGGSTITQQVIKNLTHNADVSLQRKIPEAALAIGLTQQYPKWKILEMYFNVAPFGAQELGVEAAVEDYFGLHRQCDSNFKCVPGIAFLDRDLSSCKNANDLNTCKSNPLLALARASLLAGLPQNPPAYDPTVNQTTKNNAFLRQDYVLNQMMQLGMSINLGLGGDVKDANLGPITPAIIQQVEALTQKIHFVGFKYVKNAPHFVDWVIPIIEEALGNGDGQLGVQLFTQGGFNIRTTLDLDLETYIEKDVYRHLDEPEYQYFLSTYPYGPLNKYHNVNDAAVVVENSKDGEILAMDGSANYSDGSPQVAGQFN